MIPYCILAIEDDNDRAFMEALYQNYQRLMYSEIYKVVKNEWDTDDVLQSVLVKLIDKLPTLQGKERNRLVNYIISTCRNTAYNFVRDRKQPREQPYEEYVTTADPDFDGRKVELYLIQEEEYDCLIRIWPKLDERSRHLLEGYYILDKSMVQLATELGIKPGSVRMALTRARKSAFALIRDEIEIKE